MGKKLDGNRPKLPETLSKEKDDEGMADEQGNEPRQKL